MARAASLLVVAGLALGGCAIPSTSGASSGDSSGTDPQQQIVDAPTVLYEVDGTATSAQITMHTPSGQSQQTVDLPLTANDGTIGLSFDRFEYGDFLYLSAQNVGDDTGTLTCRIRVDGNVVSENQASGSFATATCEADA